MNFGRYLWKSNSLKGQIILIFMIALIFMTALAYSFYQGMSFADMWDNWLEPFLAFSTITIAFLIAYNEKQQDWENSLPKKLNASFVFIDKGIAEQVIYKVENAPLSGSDDIRQWGQQIGRQMNNNDNLVFNGFKVEGPDRRTSENGDYVMQYYLTVWLKEIGSGIERKVWIYDDNGKLRDEKTLLSIEADEIQIPQLDKTK